MTALLTQPPRRLLPLDERAPAHIETATFGLG
jgi:hypothetical protein